MNKEKKKDLKEALEQRRREYRDIQSYVFGRYQLCPLCQKYKSCKPCPAREEVGGICEKYVRLERKMDNIIFEILAFLKDEINKLS